jgi:hypothetical protein
MSFTFESYLGKVECNMAGFGSFDSLLELAAIYYLYLIDDGCVNTVYRKGFFAKLTGICR